MRLHSGESLPRGGTLAAAICLQCWGWCWLGASNRRMEQDGAWLLAGKHREHGESQPLICFLAALSASSHRRIVTCPCPPALNSPPGPAPPAFASPLLVLGCGAPALPPSLASLPVFPSAPAARTSGFPAQLPFLFPTSSPASLPFSTLANPALLRALPPSLPCSPSPISPSNSETIIAFWTGWLGPIKRVQSLPHELGSPGGLLGSECPTTSTAPGPSTHGWAALVAASGALGWKGLRSSLQDALSALVLKANMKKKTQLLLCL